MKRIMLLCMVVFILSACSQCADITIVDAKIATAMDEKLMPVQVTDKFPKDSSKVVCWFRWESAKVNTQLIAKWDYLTDGVHVLDYPVYIHKKQGMGSVALTTQEGKTLPSGEYKVDLTAKNRVLKSLTFTIE